MSGSWPRDHSSRCHPRSWDQYVCLKGNPDFPNLHKPACYCMLEENNFGANMGESGLSALTKCPHKLPISSLISQINFTRLLQSLFTYIAKITVHLNFGICANHQIHKNYIIITNPWKSCVESVGCCVKQVVLKTPRPTFFTAPQMSHCRLSGKYSKHTKILFPMRRGKKRKTTNGIKRLLSCTFHIIHNHWQLNQKWKLCWPRPFILFKKVYYE